MTNPMKEQTTRVCIQIFNIHVKLDMYVKKTMRVSLKIINRELTGFKIGLRLCTFDVLSVADV